MIKIRNIFFALSILIISGLQVNAISVVSDYLANGTLELISGESKVYSIRLQNPSNQEANIKLDYDTTLIKVIDYKEIYALAPKETGYRILFNVTAPKEPGLHSIGYTVSEVEPSGGGIPIRLKISRNFNLRVIENPNKSKFNYSSLGYIAITLIIIYLLFKRHNNKKPYKKISNRNQKWKNN